MKKRILWILLVALLTGCSCKHEWTEADCVNPRICTKCEELGGEALGHDWTDATCLEPQTCRRCAATQGESLGHSFGDWTFAGEEMSHSCTLCGLSEKVPLDREVYAESLLSGFWEGIALFHEETTYSAYQFHEPLDALQFGADRAISGHINTKAVSGQWEFLEYQEAEGNGEYHFTYTDDGELVWYLLLVEKEPKNLLYILYPNGDQVLLAQNDTLAEQLIAAGSWGAEGGTGMFHLTFHEDRRVTGDLEGEFEGTWQLMPMTQMMDFPCCGFFIQYDRNGETVSLMGTIRPSNNALYSTTFENFSPGVLSITIANRRTEFEPMDMDVIEAKGKQMQDGPNRILGTWSSLYHRKLTDGPAIDKSLLGYSITFHSDNTFTGFVGKEISGTWRYNDSSGDDNSGSHSYYAQLDGENYAYRVNLEYHENQYSELRFWGRTTDPNNNRMLILSKLSEAEKDMIHSFIGKWTSTREDFSNYDTGEERMTSTMDYSFELFEDGTFTAYDGAEIKGTWSVAYLHYNDDGKDPTYTIELQYGDLVSPNCIKIYTDDNQVTSAEFLEVTGDHRRSIQIKQFTQQQLADALLGPELPIGKWVSTCVTEQTPSGDVISRTETSDYSLSIREDGTVTAAFITPFEGTWSFDQYLPDSGYYYDIESPAMGDALRYFYVSPDENFLSIRVETADVEYFYQMEKIG